MKSNTAPPRRPSTTPSLGLITSSSPSTRTSTSNRSSISSSSGGKSPGSSPRTPLLLSTIEPSTLNLSDDPSLDMDFELLFLHDDAANNNTTRTKPLAAAAAAAPRGKSIFTEEQQQQHIYPSSRHISSNLPLPPNEPPTGIRRRDWSTFNFSHYAPPAVSVVNFDTTSDAAHGYGYAGAVGVRGKGRIAEMYTRNRAEMPRRRR